MYTLVRAVVRYANGPRGYQPLDVSAIPLNSYYKYFKEVFIVITDSLYSKNVSIKYTDYQSSFGAYTGTIQDWLNDNSSVVLKTYTEYPSDVWVTATLHDIQYEWFSLYPADTRRSSKDQSMIALADAPDIRVHKTDNSEVDYDGLAKYTLWLVNNHFVRHMSDGTDIYLYGAGKHYLTNTNTHVCCINFNGLGEVITQPIGIGDISYEKTGNFQHLKVKTTQDLSNKTIWMVIGGRLYMNDVINVSGESQVTVDINKVDWFDKIFTSRHWIDLTRVIPKDQIAVDKDYFRNADFFTKLLTDQSSFFVFIDNTTMEVTLLPTQEYRFPFTYHTERTDNLPLLLNNGLVPKYSQRKIGNRRLLDIDSGTHKRYLYPTTGVNNGGGMIHEEVNLNFPERYNRGYLLEIKALKGN